MKRGLGVSEQGSQNVSTEVCGRTAILGKEKERRTGLPGYGDYGGGVLAVENCKKREVRKFALVVRTPGKREGRHCPQGGPTPVNKTRVPQRPREEDTESPGEADDRADELGAAGEGLWRKKEM